MKKKWRNCELSNVNDTKAIKAVRKYCNTNGIQYETSDAGYEYTHFEIFCTSEIAKTINAVINGYGDSYH